MLYRFADYIFEISDVYGFFKEMSVDYVANNVKPDYTVKVLDEEVLRLKYRQPMSPMNAVRSMAFLKQMSEWLGMNNAFVMHSACFDVNGIGVAFAAHSGTGKSTHMMLWQQLLGDKMTVVNGDKPIVRFFENEPNIPYAYGTPWNGKERLGCNMRTPLKHICFIERAEENSVERIEPSAAINRILNQVYMPKDPVAAMNTINLINRLISCCDLWIIKCNMDISAAETAYKAIFENA